MIDRIGKEYYKIETDDDDEDGSVVKEKDFYYQFIDNLIRSKAIIKSAINSFEKNFKNADFESLQQIVDNARAKKVQVKEAESKASTEDDASSRHDSSSSHSDYESD
jgi:hypothetical protein